MNDISTAIDPHPTNTVRLDAYWMPFTVNRQFKTDSRLLVAAKDMHYSAADGREILGGTAGLWCCNAGHGRAEIAKAALEGCK